MGNDLYMEALVRKSEADCDCTNGIARDHHRKSSLMQ